MKRVSENVVTVVGSGYVGTTTAALLSAIGIKTYALDIDIEKINQLKKGQAPFYEQGLHELVAYGVETGKLIPTISYEESVGDSNIVISAVGTPDNSDGSLDLTHVFSALNSIAQNSKGLITYVQKSTVPVGTGKQIEQKYVSISKSGFNYVSAPEFLREGTAILDAIETDRIVIGGSDETSKRAILDIFVEVSKQRKLIAEITKLTLKSHTDPKEYMMSTQSAELTKVTANAFLAMKISFANSIAKLADETDADINEVMDAVGSDNRIGRAFLNAGRGYGGGCFPKDVKGLIYSGRDSNAPLEIMKAVETVNESMPDYIVNKISHEIDLSNSKVAVLGLAFKAGTSDIRKSPGIRIANLLKGLGAKVFAFDPKASAEAKIELGNGVDIVYSAAEAIISSDVVVIATEWKDFLELDMSIFEEKFVFDAMNLMDMEEMKKHSVKYIGVGRKLKS